MKQSKKTPKDSTPLISLTKDGLWDYNPNSMAVMLFPEKEAWRERLIYTLFEWLKNPEHLQIEDFCYEYKIPRRKLDKWKLQYEDIGQALEDIKIFLGARRRKGAMNFKLQYGAAYRDMHMYDPQWGPLVDEYHAKLKVDQANEGPKVITVEIPVYKKSDEDESGR